MESDQVSDEEMGVEERNGTVEPETDSIKGSPPSKRPPPPARRTRAKRSKRNSSSEEESSANEEENELNTSTMSQNKPLARNDNMIHVGSEYQAAIEMATENAEAEPDRDEPIWENPVEIDEEQLFMYISEAVGRYKLSIDRALYLLQQTNYQFEPAMTEVSKRKDLKDEWDADEKTLFSTCFFHFGKRFRKIRAVLPNRSVASIVQYYYDTKKHNNYKTMVDVKLEEQNDTYDQMVASIEKLSTVPSGMCENCNTNTAVLLQNTTLKRRECKPCFLYFSLVRVPRPATLRKKVKEQPPLLPDYMVPYVSDYIELTKRSDGKSVERLGIGKARQPDDEECMVINECDLRKPSPGYFPPRTIGQDPVDSNTCRMTRFFETSDALNFISNTRKTTFLCVPLVWREKETRSMEECEILNEEARRKMNGAIISVGKVNMNEVRQWRAQINQLKDRSRRYSEEPEDEPPMGSRSGRVRFDNNWSDEEKRDVIRCFHWYNTDFEGIAEVMRTKTAEQCKAFYFKNERVISKSIETYSAMVRIRMERLMS